MRKTDQVSQDKPEIRLHRYEHILAVKMADMRTG
jgi:hypothetical protein